MTQFSEDPINEAIYGPRGIITAIDILFKHDCVIYGVMMILCGIDIMSNLVRLKEKKNESSDFKDWVRKYVSVQPSPPSVEIRGLSYCP